MTTRITEYPRPRAGRWRLAILLIAWACDAAVAPRPPRIEVLSGDGQVGKPRETLSESVSIVLRDRDGNPIPNEVVVWATNDGGLVSPETSITDDNGTAVTSWTLGPATGLQHLSATGDGEEVRIAAVAKVDPGGITLLALTTFDGSGQTVHPDFASREGSSYLAITPYPGGNASYENPSLFASTDRLVWRVPAGVTNPIVSPARGEYLSDPDIVVTDAGERWLYYRAVADRNIVRLVRSADGVHFSQPIEVASAANHDLVSPSVVRRGPNDWLMWSINANTGCSAASTTVELRRSLDGIHWTSPQPVTLRQPGFFAWHIDVQWIPSRAEFWAVYNGKVAGSCTTAALFVATSSDGISWSTFPGPILERGAIPEFQDVVYRSTFAYDAGSDAIDLWYSGARYDGRDYVWRTAYQRRARAELFATAASPGVSALQGRSARAPELTNPP
jgi:hypothetical protein